MCPKQARRQVVQEHRDLRQDTGIDMGTTHVALLAVLATGARIVTTVPISRNESPLTIHEGQLVPDSFGPFAGWLSTPWASCI
jgi:hypothetical protein